MSQVCALTSDYDLVCKCSACTHQFFKAGGAFQSCAAPAMAPKAKGKAAAAPPQPPPVPLGVLPAGMPDPNTEWLAEVQRAVEIIKDCCVFGPDICSQEALPLTGDPKTTMLGFQAPYTEAIAREKGTAKCSFTCGVNALWASPLQSIAPGVPLIPAAIKELMGSMFPNGPAPVEHTLVFKAQPNGTIKFGDALRVSPEEPQHALLLKIAERIAASAPQTELMEWKRVLLSCPGRIAFFDTDDDVYFHLTNARVKALTSARAMAHKTSQIIIDIFDFKLRKEATLGTLSAAKIAEIYQETRPLARPWEVWPFSV